MPPETCHPKIRDDIFEKGQDRLPVHGLTVSFRGKDIHLDRVPPPTGRPKLRRPPVFGVDSATSTVAFEDVRGLLECEFGSAFEGMGDGLQWLTPG